MLPLLDGRAGSPVSGPKVAGALRAPLPLLLGLGTAGGGSVPTCASPPGRPAVMLRTVRSATAFMRCTSPRRAAGFTFFFFFFLSASHISRKLRSWRSVPWSRSSSSRLKLSPPVRCGCFLLMIFTAFTSWSAVSRRRPAEMRCISFQSISFSWGGAGAACGICIMPGMPGAPPAKPELSRPSIMLCTLCTAPAGVHVPWSPMLVATRWSSPNHDVKPRAIPGFWAVMSCMSLGRSWPSLARFWSSLTRPPPPPPPPPPRPARSPPPPEGPFSWAFSRLRLSTSKRLSKMRSISSPFTKAADPGAL
mmetsp:Transcript_1709/g.5596  ORF Transcript_1709/g.5596 Transcript_1709/m.5596 type:complete len:306 (-) Transcript_1709:503-1420(-)